MYARNFLKINHRNHFKDFMKLSPTKPDLVSPDLVSRKYYGIRDGASPILLKRRKKDCTPRKSPD